MNSETPYYRTLLRAELEERMDRNPRYSVRAFADALGLQAGALSQILSGKRRISTRVVDRILGVIELSEGNRNRFVRSVLEEKQSAGLRKIDRRIKAHVKTANESHRVSGETLQVGEIGLDEFRVISDWYYYAILEMTFKSDFKPDSRWIASRLGIAPFEAKLAVERLMELGLLDVADGRGRKTEVSIDTQDKTKSSIFHRKRQKQILEKAIYSLENDPIEDRNHSALTLCINPERIFEAKARIQKFIWELGKELEAGPQVRVYELSIQLFPLEKKTK